MDASIRRALRTLERSEVTISVHVPVLINYESPAESELFDAYLDYDQAMARRYLVAPELPTPVPVVRRNPADERRRRAARRTRATGAPADRVAEIREILRTGGPPYPEHLRFLARLGDPDHMAAVGLGADELFMFQEHDNPLQLMDLGPMACVVLVDAALGALQRGAIVPMWLSSHVQDAREQLAGYAVRHASNKTFPVLAAVADQQANRIQEQVIGEGNYAAFAVLDAWSLLVRLQLSIGVLRELEASARTGLLGERRTGLLASRCLSYVHLAIASCRARRFPDTGAAGDFLRAEIRPEFERWAYAGGPSSIPLKAGRSLR